MRTVAKLVLVAARVAFARGQSFSTSPLPECNPANPTPDDNTGLRTKLLMVAKFDASACMLAPVPVC